MIDREKVIIELEQCLDDSIAAVVPADTVRAALALLKAQEPRLVTEDDFMNADKYGWLPAWCEERFSGDVYCECILDAALKVNGIRYWTACPTDEQREETPW